MPEPNEMIVTLQDVATRLGGLGIEYMVTGSVAMSAYATARTTMDIDVIIEVSNRDIDRLQKRFREQYYIDRNSIRRALDRQSMFNVLNLNTGLKVDFIVLKNTEFEAAKFNRRRVSRVGNTEFWVIGKEDLILSKLEWAKNSHSELQFRDVRNLLESGADEEFLMEMIKRHGLADVWRAFEEWKTRIAK